MKVVMLLALFTALGIGGCASAPPLVQPSVTPWPTSVADVCPTRTVSQECFRGAGFPKGAINTGMEALIEALRTCHRPGAESVLVKVTVETRDGSATCVERSPRDDETARCVAAVVARDLQIPGSTPDETCRFTYPFRFQQSD
jgi:hypothetical protein